MGIGHPFESRMPRRGSSPTARNSRLDFRAGEVAPTPLFNGHAFGEIARLIDLHAVQLHGQEDAGYVTALKHVLPASCEIWTVLSVGREPLTGRGGDRLLFDNADGGSGRSFDWPQVAQHAELPRAILAGGIGPHNARAARGLGAFAIDVGSALDLKPGRKSPEKIAALFDALRPASKRRLHACA